MNETNKKNIWENIYKTFSIHLNISGEWFESSYFYNVLHSRFVVEINVSDFIIPISIMTINVGHSFQQFLCGFFHFILTFWFFLPGNRIWNGIRGLNSKMYLFIKILLPFYMLPIGILCTHQFDWKLFWKHQIDMVFSWT